MAQGDASLAGAAYGIYKGDQLVDTYYTDEAGQFTTGYYVCGDYWTFVRSAPPRNICWTAPFILSAQRQSITPLS